jgi:peptidoglycan hydrolase-like protein with peptidoglycan-binding domain
MRNSIIVVGIATLLVPTFSFAQDTGTPHGGYCPQISQNLHRGMRDADTTPPGQVSELQKFLVDYYDLNPDTYVTGYFGRLTQQNVIRFQIDQNIAPASGYVGPLTKAAIQRVCGRTAGGVPNPPIACDHPAPPQGCYWQHGATCAQDQLICSTGNAAPTCTLAATPSTIQVGQSSTLSLTSTNATGGTISTIGTVAATGSLSISPTQNTTYNGTFLGPGGSAQCFATLTLTPAASAWQPQPPLTDTLTITSIDGPGTLEVTQAGTWHVHATAPAGSSPIWYTTWTGETDSRIPIQRNCHRASHTSMKTRGFIRQTFG